LILKDELAEARRGKGLTQSTLAKIVNTDEQGIYRLEAGVGSFSLLLRIMAALDFHIIGLARGMTLAEQFGNRRRAMMLSKAEAARRAGIMVNTVTALEAGQGSVASALKLLTVLGTRRMKRKKPTFTIVTPLAAGEKDKRFTPIELLNILEQVWGPISLDPCGHAQSPVKAGRRILLSEGGDGLRDEWQGDFVYCNPPFSAATAWLKRAAEMYDAGKVGVVATLIPAKVDSVYFQTELAPRCDTIFLRGRLQFGRVAGEEDKATRAPFPAMLVVLGATKTEIEQFMDLNPCLGMMHDGERPREIGRPMTRF
jgi:DNA-binding XRE family transcriptional regulator